MSCLSKHNIIFLNSMLHLIINFLNYQKFVLLCEMFMFRCFLNWFLLKEKSWFAAKGAVNSYVLMNAFVLWAHLEYENCF